MRRPPRPRARWWLLLKVTEDAAPCEVPADPRRTPYRLGTNGAPCITPPPATPYRNLLIVALPAHYDRRRPPPSDALDRAADRCAGQTYSRLRVLDGPIPDWAGVEARLPLLPLEMGVVLRVWLRHAPYVCDARGRLFHETDLPPDRRREVKPPKLTVDSLR